MKDDPVWEARRRHVIAEIAVAVNDVAEAKGLKGAASVARYANMDVRQVRRLLDAEFCTFRVLVPLLDALGMEIVVQKRKR